MNINSCEKTYCMRYLIVMIDEILFWPKHNDRNYFWISSFTNHVFIDSYQLWFKSMFIFRFLYQCKVFYAEKLNFINAIEHFTNAWCRQNIIHVFDEKKNFESIWVAAIMTSLFISILTKLLLNFAISQGITNSL